MNVATAAAAALRGHVAEEGGGGERGGLDKLFHIPLDLYLPSGPAMSTMESLLNGR